MDGYPGEKKRIGCCITVLFRRRSFWPRKPSTTKSIPPSNGDNGRKLTSPSSRRRQGGHKEVLSETHPTILVYKEKPPPIIISPINTRTNPPQYQTIGKTAAPLATTSVLTTKTGTGPLALQKNISISRELELMMPDHRSKENSTLVRASSSNMMVFGNLGNNKQSGNGKAKASSPPQCTKALDYLPMTARKTGSNQKGEMGNMNAVKAAGEEENGKGTEAVFCRALSKRLDPEELKVMGNEEYKKGNLAAALALYDRAIVMDPDKASYRSNKSAALMGLGQLLEAVEECREAVKLEPKLGDAEKAQKHYKLSGTIANPAEIAQAQSLQTHLTKSNEARKLRDWHTMVKGAQCAFSSGADSAPQVFASQAEALLKLCKHEEADSTLSRAPIFNADASTKFSGAASNAYFFLICAQVDMGAGRFEEAVAMAQQAAWLNSSNKEVGIVVRRTRAVASARTNGNKLFKASNFDEACAAYGEGLENDAYNAILLCNRAACRLKLGQFEKAIEDCTSALNIRPSYGKARLRRADCNAKVGGFHTRLSGVMRETPEDNDVQRALLEAQAQPKKQRGQNVKDMKGNGDMVIIPSNNQHVSSPSSPVYMDGQNEVGIEESPYLTEPDAGTSPTIFRMHKRDIPMSEGQKPATAGGLRKVCQWLRESGNHCELRYSDVREAKISCRRLHKVCQ